MPLATNPSIGVNFVEIDGMHRGKPGEGAGRFRIS
jgi:hypothetical protein